MEIYGILFGKLRIPLQGCCLAAMDDTSGMRPDKPEFVRFEANIWCYYE